MTKANYIHELHAKGGYNILTIEDLDIGGMSVTNDIENVVQDVEKMERINAERYVIVYRDSEGVWDGWDARNSRFVHCGQDTWQDAVEVMKQRVYHEQQA